MARRKWIGLVLGMAAAGGLALLLLHQRRPEEAPLPSLLGRALRFDAALTERAWKEIAARGDLAKVFFRERVNRYFPEQAVGCRVKYEGVSRQALLAPAGSRIELELNVEKGDRLAFAIFNPGEKLLKFLVKAGPEGRERSLFRGMARQGIGRLETVLLSRDGAKKMRVVLETQGRGLGAWIGPCQLRGRARPRTVLILVLDTMRADHVSAYGYPRLTTPALDGLAKGSLLFTRAFSSTSWTLPAHVSLFSGRDVLGHGVVTPESLIPADLPMLAEAMEAGGFVTLAQTGGGFVDDRYGFSRGFQSYACHPKDIFQREAAGLLFGSFLEDVADWAGQDLFVFLHTYQMHAPYKAPDRYFRAFNPGLEIKLQGVDDDLRALGGPSAVLPAAAAARRQELIDLYDASILYSDQELLKPLLAYLRRSRRLDDAMLVVLSDHGEEFHDHGEWEHGHTLYQELTRIPLVVKLPGQRRGEVRSRLVSISDVAGMIRRQYGLRADGAGAAPTGQGGPQRVLELSLPVSPFHSGLFGKVSFVGHDYQFIHNFLLPAGQPVVGSDEWFTLADMPATAGTPCRPPAALNTRYKRRLADYINRLKGLRRDRGRIDPELLEKLKALGYLNN
jgi:hypothetical protein